MVPFSVILCDRYLLWADHRQTVIVVNPGRYGKDLDYLSGTCHERAYRRAFPIWSGDQGDFGGRCLRKRARERSPRRHDFAGMLLSRAPSRRMLDPARLASTTERQSDERLSGNTLLPVARVVRRDGSACDGNGPGSWAAIRSSVYPPKIPRRTARHRRWRRCRRRIPWLPALRS
ncbi:MAG: hypothetical protein H6R26_3086 [Proteobacteria bacterium]|nr:hypothetical protein [Pseudomonadota bacterium]